MGYRKARTRSLIQLGGLIEKIGIAGQAVPQTRR